MNQRQRKKMRSKVVQILQDKHLDPRLRSQIWAKGGEAMVRRSMHGYRKALKSFWKWVGRLEYSQKLYGE